MRKANVDTQNKEIMTHSSTDQAMQVLKESIANISNVTSGSIKGPMRKHDELASQVSKLKQNFVSSYEFNNKIEAI